MWAAGGSIRGAALAGPESTGSKLSPVKIHVVYVGLGGAWPKPEFDAKAEVAKFRKQFDAVRARLGDVEFVGGELIPNSDAAAVEAVLALLKEA